MAWRERDLPASIVPFLAKPPRSLRPIYPSEAFAPSAPLREPHYSRDTFFSPSRKDRKDLHTQRSLRALRAFARSSLIAGYFFLAKPPRSLSPAYPSGAFAFFAPLRENNYYLRESFSLSRQDRKDLYTPAEPLRPLRLCEILINRGIFFLAKPPRSLSPAYPAKPPQAMYPAQGRASCPPMKNDPTAEKCPKRFENITTDFIIGRTLFVEGHKALPCTDTYLAR